MSDIICTYCRGETTAGCGMCNPSAHTHKSDLQESVRLMIKARDDRISVLEAENAALKAQIASGVVITERVTGAVMDRIEWQIRAEAADAKLRAVEGLPEKWRSECGDYPECKYDCADELEAALKKGERP